MQSLASDRQDDILLGTYEDALPTLVSQTTGIAAQPQISWQPVEPLNRPAGHEVLMDSFIEAILNGGESVVNGESTRPAVELINAIVFSAIQKKTVDLPLDREEYDQLFEALSSGKMRVPELKRKA